MPEKITTKDFEKLMGLYRMAYKGTFDGERANAKSLLVKRCTNLGITEERFHAYVEQNHPTEVLHPERVSAPKSSPSGQSATSGNGNPFSGFDWGHQASDLSEMLKRMQREQQEKERSQAQAREAQRARERQEQESARTKAERERKVGQELHDMFEKAMATPGQRQGPHEVHQVQLDKEDLAFLLQMLRASGYEKRKNSDGYYRYTHGGNRYGKTHTTNQSYDSMREQQEEDARMHEQKRQSDRRDAFSGMGGGFPGAGFDAEYFKNYYEQMFGKGSYPDSDNSNPFNT